MASYGFSKALMTTYAKNLAKREKDLLVNVLSPGLVDTDMTKNWKGNFVKKTVKEGI